MTKERNRCATNNINRLATLCVSNTIIGIIVYNRANTNQDNNGYTA